MWTLETALAGRIPETEAVTPMNIVECSLLSVIPASVKDKSAELPYSYRTMFFPELLFLVVSVHSVEEVHIYSNA